MPIQIADAYRDSEFAKSQTGLLFNLQPPNESVEQLPEGLSLCMIVKNEERFLAECLDSVKDAVDEINIVDTGSTDRTVEIARSYGAKVEFREWRNDFSWARNESLKMATRRWIIVLDADEEIDRDSRAVLRSVRTVPAGLAAVYLQIVNHVDDYTGAGLMSHILPRLFPNNPRIHYRNVIHEGLTLENGELSAAFSPIRIIHKGYTAEILRGREKAARNMPLVERAFAANGEDQFALFNFGVSAISAGNTEPGIEALEKMLALGGPLKMFFPLGYTVLSLGYGEQRGDLAKALEVLNRGLQDFPHDANLLFAKGQFLLQDKRYEAARATLETLLEKRQLSRLSPMVDDEVFEWKVFFVIAGTYQAEGDTDAALSWLEEAVRNKPSPFLQRNKARILEGAERYFDAEVAWRDVAERDPGQGRVEYVNYLLRRKRFSAAIAQVQEHVDFVPSEVAAQLNLSAARAVRNERLDDPVPFLKAVLRVWPASATALSMLEEIYQERGQTAELERLHRDELTAECVRVEDFVRRAYRLLAAERNEEALKTAERGLLAEPSNARLRFNSALAAIRLNDEVRALLELGAIDAKVAEEVFGTAMSMQAAILQRRGDVEGALAAVERWIDAEPSSSDALLKRAEVLANAGRNADARAALEERAAADQRVALELAGMLLREGDIAGAGRVASLALHLP